MTIPHVYSVPFLVSAALLLAGCGPAGQGGRDMKDTTTTTTVTIQDTTITTTLTKTIGGCPHMQHLDVSYEVNDKFTALHVDDIFTAHVSVGAVPSVSIDIPTNIRDDLSVVLAGTTLRLALRGDQHTLQCNQKVIATIVVKRPLENVTATGFSVVNLDTVAGPLATSGSSTVHVASANGLTTAGFSIVNLDTLAGPLSATGSSKLHVASAIEGSHVISVSDWADAKIRDWRPNCSSQQGRPCDITVTSLGGYFSVSSGKAADLTVVASSSATVRLESLKVDRCTAITRGFGKVIGMNVEMLSLQAEGSSVFKATVSKMLSGQCKQFAEVTINASGGADVSTFRQSDMCTFSKTAHMLHPTAYV